MYRHLLKEKKSVKRHCSDFVDPGYTWELGYDPDECVDM